MASVRFYRLRQNHARHDNNATRHLYDINIDCFNQNEKRHAAQKQNKFGKVVIELLSGKPTTRMSTWSDQDSVAITNWLSITNEKPPIASTPGYPPSPPSLASSASSPESEEISAQSRKRKRSDIGQDHLEQAQKRTYQQSEDETAEYREGHFQSKPKYFEMDEDKTSIAGSNLLLISNKPILEAKLLSRQSSRSTSPI